MSNKLMRRFICSLKLTEKIDARISLSNISSPLFIFCQLVRSFYGLNFFYCECRDILSTQLTKYEI